MNFDEAVEIAKRTWYPEDHPLHFNPHHPLGKLLGEWGELLDDFMKSLYKPGYIFKPEDELGDIWYYVRILAYQTGVVPKEVNRLTIPEVRSTIIFESAEVDILIKSAIYELSQYILTRETTGLYFSSVLVLSYQYSVLIEIARRYDLTLGNLTGSNWQKLKPGSERGEQWMKTRENTEYVGGKIAKGGVNESTFT